MESINELFEDFEMPPVLAWFLKVASICVRFVLVVFIGGLMIVGSIVANCFIFLLTSGIIFGRIKRNAFSSGHYIAIDTALTGLVHTLCNWR